MLLLFTKNSNQWQEHKEEDANWQSVFVRHRDTQIGQGCVSMRTLRIVTENKHRRNKYLQKHNHAEKCMIAYPQSTIARQSWNCWKRHTFAWKWRDLELHNDSVFQYKHPYLPASDHIKARLQCHFDLPALQETAWSTVWILLFKVNNTRYGSTSIAIIAAPLKLQVKLLVESLNVHTYTLSGAYGTQIVLER